MAPVATITVEGVLAFPSENFPSAQPRWDGLRLFHALKTRYRIILLADAPTKDVSHWLDLYGVEPGSFDLLLGGDSNLLRGEGRLAQITQLHRLGRGVDLVVESDPDVATGLLREGYATLLFTRPEFHASEKEELRPWADLEAEVSRQRVHREAMTADIGSRFEDG